MKKIYLILACLIFTQSFAGFPVKRNSNTEKIETIVDSNSLDSTSVISNAVAADVSFGGLFLGLLLGLIGVGLAYIFSSDETFRRSSWYGLGVWIILLLLLGI